MARVRGKRRRGDEYALHPRNREACPSHLRHYLTLQVPGTNHEKPHRPKTVGPAGSSVHLSPAPLNLAATRLSSAVNDKTRPDAVKNPHRRITVGAVGEQHA